MSEALHTEAVANEAVIELSEDERAGYDAAWSRVALADLSGLTRVALTGADRVKLLNNLSTNDIARLPVGQGCELFLLDAKGRILFYLVALQRADDLWVEGEPGCGAALVRHFDRYIIRENVQPIDRTESTRQFHLAGPHAFEVVQRAASGVGPLDPLAHVEASMAGVPCTICRRDRSLAGGFDVYCHAEQGPAVHQALCAAGRDFGLAAIGPRVLELLRVEAGIPRSGREVTEDNLPQEIGRDAQAISFTKGCYIGQETVARLDSYGHVNKKLAGLTFDTSAELRLGCVLRHGDKEVGKLASLVASPRAGRLLGMAVVRAAAASPGQKLLAETASGVCEGTTVPLPFHSVTGVS